MQDNLFDLIQSLSPSEKRYITTNAKKGAKYLELLQTIYDMEVFDEETLKDSFGKNLPVEKNNLYNIILKNIRNFHSEKAGSIEIKSLIIDAQLLLDRGLYEQGLKRLKKAKKLAHKYHKTIDAWEITTLEKKLLFRINPIDLTKQIDQSLQEQNTLFNHLEQEKITSSLCDQVVTTFVNRIKISTEKEKEDFIEKFPKKEWSVLTSKRAEYNLLLYQKFRATLLDDKQQVLYYCQELLNWWAINKPLIKIERRSHLLEKLNYLVACMDTKNFKDIPPILKELETIEPETTNEEKMLTQRLFPIKHWYYMNRGEFEKAKTEYQKIEKQLSELIIAEKRVIITVNHAISLFILEDYKNCILYLDSILTSKRVEIRTGIQLMARSLKCLAWYELKEEEGFDSSYRAARRYLTAVSDEMKDIEGAFLSLVRRLNNSTEREKKEVIQEIYLFLSEAKNNPNLVHWLGLNEYSLWIESKIKNLKMNQIFKNSLNKN